MKLKQIVRYKLEFGSQWAAWSGACMGLAFFLRAVYFFGVRTVQTVPAGILIIGMILPMLLEAAWFILLRTVHLNAPGIFGILGVVYCLFLGIHTFTGGNVLVAILSFLLYVLMAAAFLAIVGGFIRQKSIAVAACVLILVLRLICWHFTNTPFLVEAATWSGIWACLCLAECLQEIKQ